MAEAGMGSAIDDAIAGRVIPELLRRFPACVLCPGPDTIARLADLAEHPDPTADAALLDAVARLARNDDGTRLSVPWLCHGILVPVARELGERWVRDDTGFDAVTLGTGRLHAVLRALDRDRAGPAMSCAPIAGWRAPRILLLPAPGEDHRFGPAVVGALFRDAGWIVQTGEAPPGNESEATADATLLRLLDRLPPDLVGISAACDRHVPALRALVARLRRLRPALVLVGGGPLFSRHPRLGRRLGLDAAFTNGSDAPTWAARLLAGPAGDPGPDAAIRPTVPRSVPAARETRHRDNQLARAFDGPGTRNLRSVGDSGRLGRDPVAGRAGNRGRPSHRDGER